MTTQSRRPVTRSSAAWSAALAAAIATARTPTPGDRSGLAEVSKRNYLRSLRLLAEFAHKDDGDCWAAIADHKNTIDELKRRYGDRHASAASYSRAVLAAFKYLPQLKTEARGGATAHAAWNAYHAQLLAPIKQHEMSAKPTKRQAQAWVTLDQVVAVRDALPVGSPERLLLCCYTMIAPKRNDLGQARIYAEPPPPGTPGNYVVLPPPGAKAEATLVLQEYKTAKVYKTMTETLPQELVQEIRASLQSHPRDHLFVSARNGRPYASANTFDAWAMKALRNAFDGRRVTLTILRHAYITAMKFDELTPAERLEVANKMMHSPEQQGKYKFIFKSPSAIDGL